MKRAMITVGFALGIVSCKESVVVNHPDPNERLTHPITIDVTFDPRADTSTFKAAIDSTDITQTFTPAPTPGGSSTSSDPLPSLQPGPHSLSVHADMHAERIGDVLGHSTNFQVAQPTTPPSPAISLTVSPTDIAGDWGTSLSATVTVESKNGFAGNVDLIINNAPFGVTAPSLPTTLAVPSNGNVSSIVTLQTVQAATELGEQNVEIRAIPQNGTTTPRNRQLTLRVNRTSGSFGPALTLPLSGGPCGTMHAVVVPLAPGSGVKFDDAGTVLNSTAIAFDPASGYAIGAPCRSAVVIPPPTIPPTPPGPAQPIYTTDLVNLGFPSGIGRNIPPRGSVARNDIGPLIKGFFSPDGSLFVLVAPTGGSPAVAVNLVDIARGEVIPRSKLLDATVSVTGAIINNNRVTLQANQTLTDPHWVVP